MYELLAEKYGLGLYPAKELFPEEGVPSLQEVRTAEAG